MTKQNFNYLLKHYIVAIIALISCQYSVAQETINKSDTIYIPQNSKVSKQQKESGITYINVDVNAKGKKESIANYIKKNIKYPKNTGKETVQGNAVEVQFNIDENGNIKDTQIISSASSLLDAEVLRVINSIPTQIPAQKDGKNVPVEVSYPINFDKIKRPDNVLSTTGRWLPEFPGGVMAILAYIKDNVHYPKSLANEGIEGRVLVRFSVSESGEVENAELMTKIHPSLDYEALRVVQSMPVWSPGIENGKYVSVYYTIPITFKKDKPARKTNTSSF